MRPRSQNASAVSVVALLTTAAASLTCGGEPTEAPAVRGQRLYADTCALCHGSQGEGYRADDAPRLAGQELLSTASDAFLRTAIMDGRPGTTMSAWSHERGGPFSTADADATVAFMRTWQTVPSVSLSVEPIVGDTAQARPVYDSECRTCHGENGENGRYPQLSNPVFLASASDGYLRAAIERGRSQTPMPAFADRLSPANVSNLVALLRSWQRPVDGPESLPPEPGNLSDVVQNPGGPEPTWDPKAQFVPADSIKAAMDEGLTFVLADARPRSDYSGGHIAGAISVPFYNVEPYLPQIPNDRFVITYCACPHAESGAAAAIFRARGYQRVAVLDEGFKIWRERGYPVRSGPKP
jgi:cytochrome c oxidase cbb3-type subunit 3